MQEVAFASGKARLLAYLILGILWPRAAHLYVSFEDFEPDRCCLAS